MAVRSSTTRSWILRTTSTVLWFLCVLVLQQPVLSLPQKLSRISTDEPSEGYLTLDQVQRLARMSNESRQRNHIPPAAFLKKHFFTWHPTFRDTVDIFFRGFMGINSSENVLAPVKLDGYRKETLISSKYSYQLNEPFISSVPSYAAKVPDIIREISNGTAQPGDIFEWIGGIASVYDTDTSNVFLLLQKCKQITIQDKAGKAIGQPMWHFIRARPPFESFLHSMEGENVPSFCGGSGAVIRGNPDMAQPLRLTKSMRRNESKQYELKDVSNLNTGVSLISLTDEQMDEFERLDDESASHHRDRLNDIEEEFNHELEEYDNIAFLILSVAAILSSAAVAGVSLGPGRERIAVVSVEATVVYSFLVIVSRAFAVFMRKQTYMVDIMLRSEGNFTYNDMIVQAKGETVVTVVGERRGVPLLLLTTEVFAVVASIGVSIIMVLNFQQLKSSMRSKASARRVRGRGEDETVRIPLSFEAYMVSRFLGLEQKLQHQAARAVPHKKRRPSSFDTLSSRCLHR